LTPAEFHKELLKCDGQLIDLRNHYESQIGYMENAILPPIRKFSSFPKWLKSQGNNFTPKVYTYCTGNNSFIKYRRD
jgi:predicted sulfurtransferase